MRQVPGGRWGLTWILALAIFGAGVAGLEAFVRRRGFVPSVKDDEYSWSLARRRVADDSAHTVAVLGTSRALLAFSPEAFRATLPGWRYVQLARQGSQAVAALRDLAFDPEFRGVALVDISENGFDWTNWHSQDDVVATYHRGWRTIGQLAERWLSTQVQSRVALLAGDGRRTLASLLVHRRWPKPRYTTTFADRTKFANYALTNVERKRAAKLAQTEGGTDQADFPRWMSAALALEVYVALIRARGGEVIYVRMPTCDERWTVDEIRFPKHLFWDQLARATSAITVHFNDHPTLTGFSCPDTSHIASKDGPRFTHALLEILRARGVFQR